MRSAEQSLVASRRVERGFNRPRHDAVVAGIANNPVSLRIGQQAVEEGRGSQAGPQNSVERLVTFLESCTSKGSPIEAGLMMIGFGERNWR